MRVFAPAQRRLSPRAPAHPAPPTHPFPPAEEKAFADKQKKEAAAIKAAAAKLKK